MSQRLPSDSFWRQFNVFLHVRRLKPAMNNKRIKYNFRSVVSNKDVDTQSELYMRPSLLENMVKAEEEEERLAKVLKEQAENLKRIEKEQVRQQQNQADSQAMQNRRVSISPLGYGERRLTITTTKEKATREATGNANTNESG